MTKKTKTADTTFVSSQVTMANGAKVSVASAAVKGTDGATNEYIKTDGALAGTTFKELGTVSADGKTITLSSGGIGYVTTAAMYVRTEANGTSYGCFIDPATNKPVSYGFTAVVYSLGTDGKLHQSWLQPNGFFYTGVVTLNGYVINFSKYGEPLEMKALY